ncbi:C45 family autoproteolytic acyltransferase/hydrolase [Mesonia ostreae]|uniref:C45 family autoproteolytic acyltransferase/hydrolase n=1 Tax=Mesonia ostreae TaxID=861110 RepID=A0ABU2KI37_9FLAO|nr:C45 family autoproteolytic acyltransferase/hydolase [Mesonia ostreae]MDT0294370.1 C45 family autoproteolytic acyltransferase/hydrolase [Mesonia ostreae]
MRKFCFLILTLTLLVSCGTKKSLSDRPIRTDISSIDTLRIQQAPNFYSLGNNSLRKNKEGLWEIYVEGDALERGVAIGSLTKELMAKQEKVFMSKIEAMVDSPSYFKFLSNVVAWYNRKLYKHVKEEYKEEIYGISRYSPQNYNSFADPYILNLYLHGAHDIGHALKDLMLVGCTSFATWGDHTSDGELLLGRNFDFYAGDEFAEEKIIAFINPANGQKFMMYTWPGFIGVVSGMNASGITVTINAGKSKIPLVAKTPIALLTREILQYASTTEEAIEIAKSREVFVSESIMVGSAKEKKAILIEVSPSNLGVYDVKNSSQLVCSNHFQSEAYKKDKRNIKAIENSHTQARFDRMTQLLQQEEQINPRKAIEILRDKKGVDNSALGFGNEMAINQLLAHHGIVFQPEKNLVWVSSNPYQLGAFVAYDLHKAFAEFEQGDFSLKGIDSLQVEADPFLETEAYKNYETYRIEERNLETAITQENFTKTAEELEKFVALNPKYWQAYQRVGLYYYKQKKYALALPYFQKALQLEVTTVPDKEELKKLIKKSKRKS